MPKNYNALIPSVGLQIPVGSGMLSQGNAWYVRPRNGADGNSGYRPKAALQTLAGGGQGLTGAVAMVTPYQNDVVYFMADYDYTTTAYCTDYQSYTGGSGALTWSNSLTHLIGVNGGQNFSLTSRVALLSTFNTAIPMVYWSANDCLCANMNFFAGVAHASPTGCLMVTGSGNHFYNCHIAGIGNATNDIAGAYSLYLNGGKENLFENCVIGLDTIDRGGASNQEILIDNGAARNIFRNCLILSRIKSTTAHPQVYFGSAAALGDPSFVLFDNCTFQNSSTNYAYAQTYVFATAANLTAGGAIVRNCVAFGATNWSASGDHVQIGVPAVNAAYTAGVGYSA